MSSKKDTAITEAACELRAIRSTFGNPTTTDECMALEAVAKSALVAPRSKLKTSGGLFLPTGAEVVAYGSKR